MILTLKPIFWKIFYYNTLRKIYDPINFGFLPKSAKNIGPKKQKKNKQCSKVISFFLTSKLPHTETKCEKKHNPDFNNCLQKRVRQHVFFEKIGTNQ